MKLSKRQKFALIVAASITLSFSTIGVLYYTAEDKPLIRYNFYGNELEFRADLRTAENVPVYPDEDTILNAIWDPEILNVTIAFMNTSDNQIVAVNSFEVGYKLSVAYMIFNWNIPFKGVEVESFENLTGSRENLVIAMVPPSVADDTAVELDNGVVYIKGVTNEDFDRATIKFLMTSMNITV